MKRVEKQPETRRERRIAKNAWLLPELSAYDSAADMTAGWRFALRRLAGQWSTWLVGLLALGGVVALTTPLTLTILHLPLVRQFAGGIPGAVLGGLVGGALGGLLPMVVLYLLRKRLRAALREHLATIAIPTCIRCGYDLRGSTSGKCPECGTVSHCGTEW